MNRTVVRARKILFFNLVGSNVYFARAGPKIIVFFGSNVL